jgi:hypothetical protein
MANGQHEVLRKKIQRTGRVPLRVQPRNRAISPIIEKAMKNPRKTRNFALGLVAAAPVRVPKFAAQGLKAARVPALMQKADLLGAASWATGKKFPGLSTWLAQKSGKAAGQIKPLLKQTRRYVRTGR